MAEIYIDHAQRISTLLKVLVVYFADQDIREQQSIDTLSNKDASPTDMGHMLRRLCLPFVCTEDASRPYPVGRDGASRSEPHAKKRRS